MSEPERPRLLIQVVLLVLGLGGWTAFAAAFFGLVNAQHRAAHAEHAVEAVGVSAEGALHEKDRQIDLLRRELVLLRERVNALEGKTRSLEFRP